MSVLLAAVDGATGGSLAGPAALLIILVLLVATVFLVRNMDKRLKKLPREFPPTPERRGRGSDDPPEP